MAKENRKHKDSVFTDLFYSDRDAKKNLLSLYNALYDTTYTDRSVIKKIRLEDVLFMNQKNDIAFSVGEQRIVLSEHQSSINPNMPLRFLMYIGREMELLVPVADRYKKKLIRIPTPEFFTFYIGSDEYPVETTLRLSDAFLVKEGEPSLELVVHVININWSKQHEILGKCEILNQYSEFINVIRKYQINKNKLELAVKECISKGILSEYLSRKSAEVVNMLMAEYSYDTDISVQRKEAEEDGFVKGENLFSALTKKLLGLNALDELEKAASASNAEKEKYYKKYGIIK